MPLTSAGPDRASRVHRRAGDRATEEGIEADGAADRDRGRGADGPGVGGHGHDHEHQEGGQDQLVDQGVAGADGRDGGSELGRLVGQTARSSSAAGIAPASWAAM